MKALRHEAPNVTATAKRLGLANANGGAVLQILKTFHTAHGGKLSLSRVLSGTIPDSATVYGGKGQDARVAGLFTLMGSTPQKIARAEAGETVALGKLDNMATGETISTVKGTTKQLIKLDVSPGVYGLAISVADRKDEVKLTSAVTKLIEEDPRFGGRGRPSFLVTTEPFLRRFGLGSLAGLPPRGSRASCSCRACRATRDRRRVSGESGP